MSVQPFRLHRSASFVTALAFVSSVVLPLAAAAALKAPVPEEIRLHTTGQPADQEEGGSTPKAVDPWDDDLGSKKPPQGSSAITGSGLCAWLVSSLKAVSSELRSVLTLRR